MQAAPDEHGAQGSRWAGAGVVCLRAGRELGCERLWGRGAVGVPEFAQNGE